MMHKKKNVVIVGAGIGGLSLAALLGKDGHKVTVLEKNNQIGGRAMIYKEKGFTFDMGPSWYLMPEVFEKYFKQFGKKSSDFYKLKQLDPQYRIFYSDKEYIDIRSDLKKNMELFESIEPGISPKIETYLAEAKYKYDVAMSNVLYRNYNNIFDFFDKDMMKAGPKLHVFESLDSYISKFTRNDKIKKILLYTMVFLGGSPKNTPALYSLMSHLDFHLGLFYPIGGIYKIIEALESLCKANNVTILTDQEVNRINVVDGHTDSVETKNHTYQADIVISNADYPFTEMELLDKKWQTYGESFWKKKTLAPSAFLMYLGIKGKIKKLQHHSLVFANDWEKHFDDIFDKNGWPDDPSYYVSCPSKSDPSVAPTGNENIMILVPVASGLDDSDTFRKKYAKKIISHFEKIVGQSIAEHIVVQKIYSQKDYTSTYNAYKGTALGLAHTLFQSAIFRPSNRSKKVKNLYYVGQYTQPGIGMPICLISAHLVADRIKKEQ
jgi:phytoene desaturase